MGPGANLPTGTRGWRWVGGGGGEVVVIGLYLVSETVTDTNTCGFVGLIPGVGGH